MQVYMLSLKTMLSGLALSAVLLMPAIATAETFQEALISVYNSNPRLQAERARLREVDESYIQARAQGRLTANLSGTYGYTAARTNYWPPILMRTRQAQPLMLRNLPLGLSCHLTGRPVSRVTKFWDLTKPIKPPYQRR